MLDANSGCVRPTYRAGLLATTALVLIATSARPGLAQTPVPPAVPQAPALTGGQVQPPAKAGGATPGEPPTPQSEQIVVTGYRRSLAVARDIKADAVIQEDVIVREDIAKFPELNLAESLQRLPGVQITREAGEGREISLQGLGPDFSRVQLNGMEVLGNNDSAMDSRGQRSRDRAFDFNIFASELFSKVVVEKTFQAAQNEGGMAGTVGLFTGRPFDYAPGFKGALTAQLGSNTYTLDAQPRVAALFSQNWGNRFGVTVSLAYAHRKTTEQGHDDYNYDQLSQSGAQSLVANGLDISHLPASEQAAFLAGGLNFPDGNRISSWDARLDRLGVTGAVQWRPVDKALLTLDVLHSSFTTHRDEYHLATRPLGSGTESWAFDTPAGPPWPAAFQTSSVLNSLAYDKNDYVTDLNVSNATFGSEHRRELNETDFNQVAITGEWSPTDRFTIDGHAGYEKSTYDTPYDDKLYLRAKGNIIANYGPSGQSASFQYPGFNMTDPNNYTTDDFYYRAFNNGSQLQEAVLNLHYRALNQLTLRAGAAYHRFQNNGINEYYDGNVNGTNGEMQGTSASDIVDVYSNNFGSWLVGDFAKAFAKYDEYHRLGPKPDGVGGQIRDIEQVFDVTESTISEYIQADWDTELFGKRFRGNVGLRGYQTDTESTGWIQGDNYAYLGTADVKGHYSGVLPALNTVLDLEKDLLLRFAATKNLNRPTLDSLAAEGTASIGDGGDIEASRGNPELKPFTDVTLDLALEYYFGKIGLLSGSVFHKAITNFIGEETLTDIPFSQTGVPVSTVPGSTGSTIVHEFSMPINIAGTKDLTGVELAVQSQLSFLPSPFDGFGVVANYTYIDLDKELTGISPTSYNATLYYETKQWGVRGSLNHRSRYYTEHDFTSAISAGTQGFEGTTYVDAAAFYNISKTLQLTFDAINITNQKETQFFGQALYLYNQTQSGTTFMGGVSLKF